MDVDIEYSHTGQRYQGAPPVDNKHDGQTDHGSDKAQPHRVIAESRTPACRRTGWGYHGYYTTRSPYMTKSLPDPVSRITGSSKLSLRKEKTSGQEGD